MRSQRHGRLDGRLLQLVNEKNICNEKQNTGKESSFPLEISLELLRKMESER